MASWDCISCGSDLHYSHSDLEARGLFCPQWVDFLKSRYGRFGWKCLQCLGFEQCVSCGVRLGTFDQVTGYRDNETGLYCGVDYCADCVVELLQNVEILSVFERAHAEVETARTCLANNAFEMALCRYSQARCMLECDELCSRQELNDLRGEVWLGLGIANRDIGKLSEALTAFGRAEEYLRGPVLRGQTSRDADLLRLFAEQSMLVDQMDDPDSWCRKVSQEACEMVDCLPPRKMAPFTGMRDNFARLHDNWLSLAIRSGSYDAIPEIILAVQGRDLAASWVEHEVSPEHFETPEAIADFLTARRGLRAMSASDGRASRNYLADHNGNLPNTEGTSFDKDFDGLRRAMLKGKSKSLSGDATEGDLPLSTPHQSITLSDLHSRLADNEHLLILFEHEEDGHAVLLGSEYDKPVYKHLPLLPELAKRFLDFDLVGRNRNGMRRCVMFDDEDVSGKELPELSNEQSSGFWRDMERDLKQYFWDPINPYLNENSTLIICSMGSMHNLSLEPSRPEKVKLLSRLPGLAYFARTRGLFGKIKEPSFSNPQQEPEIAILCDDQASDIPLAGLEGRFVSELWSDAVIRAGNPLFPHDVSNQTTIKYLHVAGHGLQEKGLMGKVQTAVRIAGGIIGEQQIINATVIEETFLNICIGGQATESPLDGNPTGLVGGFLQNGSNWIAASLVSVPDEWACLLGLIIADLKAHSNKPLPEALEQAKGMLVDGGWSERVSEGFSLGLIETFTLPRPISGLLRSVKDPSLMHELSAVVSLLQDETDEAINKAFRETTQTLAFWWLRENDALFRRMVGNPHKLNELCIEGIVQAVKMAAQTGLPRLPEIDTVRYGFALFGDHQ